jgi:transposase InsO family protein
MNNVSASTTALTATLRRQGHVVNAKRVLRLMHQDNLLAQRRKPFIVRPKGKPEEIIIVPNLVRGLVPSGPDQIWVAEITYVYLVRAFAYLAVILDAFSRRAVGWALAEGLGTSLAMTALDQALEVRRPPKGSLIHHSDAASNMRPMTTVSASLTTTSPFPCRDRAIPSTMPRPKAS